MIDSDETIEQTCNAPTVAMPVLDYSPPPERVEPAVRMPAWFVVLVAGIPFVAFFLVHGRRKITVAILQFLVIPGALGFFGPFWHNILFGNTQYAEAGMWPFIVTVVGVLASSMLIGLRAHNDFHRA